MQMSICGESGKDNHNIEDIMACRDTITKEAECVFYSARRKAERDEGQQRRQEGAKIEKDLVRPVRETRTRMLADYRGSGSH